MLPKPTQIQVPQRHDTNALYRTPRFTVVEHQVTRPDGTVATCPAVEHPGAVVILPLLDDGRICLIYNHRLTVRQTLVELPAGTRHLGEPAEQTAGRELQEETGYQAGRLDKLAEFFTSPGIADERMHAFVATDLTPGPPAREPNEQIENLLLTWDEAMALVDQGEIQDGKTLVTLLMYRRLHG